MTKSSVLDFAVSTILAFVRQNAQRLEDGVATREAIAGALARGEEVHHYRIDWLHESSRRVFDLLQRLGEEFNAAHPDDRCSTRDFGDVLATTSARIRAKAGS
jgi:hypothetical protein